MGWLMGSTSAITNLLHRRNVLRLLQISAFSLPRHKRDCVVVGRTAGDKGLQPLFERPTRQENLMTASEASQSNIGSQANDGPFVAAARVWLAQSHDIFKIKLERPISHRNLSISARERATSGQE